MCGIAGHLALHSELNADRVAAMLGTLAHRGPDGGGFWADDCLAIGHRRLAIHDLSQRGLQPFQDPEGDLVVAINGTLHNAPELRKEESARGYEFRSGSDSEVLIPLFRRLGPDLLGRLRGPFALAIYSRKRRSLMLARDRLGQKPLYLARGGEGLLFCSELGSLVRQLSQRTFRRDRAAAFLQRGYVPGNATILDEVEQLPPGSRLLSDRNGEVVERYWTPHAAQDASEGGALDLKAASALLEDRLRTAVKLRTRSDRPLGLLLSGGLDSAALLVMAHLGGADPMTVFTMGFDDPRLDEREAASRIARHCGARHRMFLFDQEPGPLLERLVRTTGELLGDSSWIPTSLLFERAAAEATVFLSGEGGDEILLGYDRHAFCARTATLGPRWARRAVSHLRHFLPPGRKRRGLSALSSDHLGAMLENLTGLMPRQDLERLLVPGVLPQPAAPEPGLPPHAGTAAGFLDLQTYLPGDLLAKGDRAAMTHGVEVWSPFLDHEVVEAALRIPGDVHLSRGRGKQVLRQILAPHVPPATLERSKRGFAVPLASWLQRGSYCDFAADALGTVTEPFQDVLRDGTALPLLRRLQAGEAHLAPLVHAAVVLALWHREFM